MKRFWQLVSKQDLVFVSLIFVAVIVLSIFESANKIKVTFAEDSVTAEAPKYSLNIPYDMVARAELVDMPDSGEVIEGMDDLASRTGHWENETWGEYYVCADLDASTCIVVYLDDGRVFVFSRKDNEETAQVFETFQTYLEKGESQ